MFGTWFLAATAVKRLHDRKSGWWMVRLLIAPDVFNRLEDRLPDSYAVAVISLVALVLCIWCFVELFCLRGTGGLTDSVLIPSPLAIGGRDRTSKAHWNLFRTVLAHRPRRMLSGGHE